jgi:hypothetical protein
MLFLAVRFVKGQAGEGLDAMDGAKKSSLGGQLKEKGAKPLANGAVAGNIGVPVTRIPYGVRRIRDRTG